MGLNEPQESKTQEAEGWVGSLEWLPRGGRRQGEWAALLMYVEKQAGHPWVSQTHHMPCGKDRVPRHWESLSWNLPGYFFQVCLSWIIKPFGNCVFVWNREHHFIVLLEALSGSCMYSTQLSAWHMWALSECNVSGALPLPYICFLLVQSVYYAMDKLTVKPHWTGPYSLNNLW